MYPDWEKNDFHIGVFAFVGTLALSYRALCTVT